jgi:hypothetical protein
MKVSTHVLYYSLLFGATSAFAYGMQRSAQSDEAKRALLENKQKNSGNQCKERQVRQAQMQDFFHKMQARDEGQAQKMDGKYVHPNITPYQACSMR